MKLLFAGDDLSTVDSLVFGNNIFVATKPEVIVWITQHRDTVLGTNKLVYFLQQVIGRLHTDKVFTLHLNRSNPNCYK